MRVLRIIYTSALLLLAAGPFAFAQIYTAGNESALKKWSCIETDRFSIVFPRGLDSLGRACAVELEKACAPIGGNLGWQPNELYSSRLPVVLRTDVAYSNGFVSWCPRRMELILGNDAYDRISLPVLQQLASHEGRHVAQMQLGKADTFAFGLWRLLIGEMSSGALASLYGGPSFLEGDAVVSETAMSGGGRGRNADFVEYLRASLDAGQYRNYWRWRYGSQRRYTTDHYLIGYVMEAGVRSFWEDSDFTTRFYRNIMEGGGWSWNNYAKTIKQATGLGLNDSFLAISARLDSVWRQEAAAKEPFTQSRKLTEERRYYTAYLSPCKTKDKLYAIRRAIDRSSALVSITPDGTVSYEMPFSNQCSRLQYSAPTGRIFWSELKQDPRWEMVSRSNIRYLDSLGRRHTLVEGRKLYNPAACQVKPLLAVLCDNGDGSYQIEILDARNGSAAQIQDGRSNTIKAPDGMEPNECCWLGEELYFSAVTREGFGIYRASDLSCVVPAKHISIKQLGTDGEHLVWVSDHSGVNEIYRLDGGVPQQLTSSRIGSSEYLFDADSLYFAQPSVDGRMLRVCSRDSLLAGVARDWEQPHRFVMADELSRGERVPFNDTLTVQMSATRPYNKLANAIRLHSWTPIYFDFDEGASLSMESISQSVSPGAVLCSQNTLGTLYGWAGIKLHDSKWKWRPSGHIKLNYRGLYPVFELRADFNDRNQILRRIYKDGDKYKSISRLGSKSLFSTSIDCYVPMTFNSGGWRRGLIPQFSIGASNDAYSRNIGGDETDGGDYHWIGRTSLSLRAWAMLPTPSSGIYPRFGAGLNLGYSSRPGLRSFFGDKIYAQLYGYLPGFYTTHSTKFAILSQKTLSNGRFAESYVQVLPRGCAAGALSASSSYPLATRFSLDYALPFASIDWGGLCPLAYVRNFELIPFFDCTLLKGKKKNATLMSAGASLSVVLGNLWCIPYDTRVGVRGAYVIQDALRFKNGWDFSMVFSVDF